MGTWSPLDSAHDDSTQTLSLPSGDRRGAMHLEQLGPGSRRFACRPSWTVGSGPRADFRIEDPYVSAIHLRCTRRPDGVWVEDADSKNGTRINGVQVRAGLLRPGMCVAMGAHRLVLSYRGGRAPLPGSACDSPDGANELTPRPAWRETMIGDSDALNDAIQHIPLLADLPQPVLILGETGTGKELVARALHEAGDRSTSPLVVLNCAAIPEQLAESELFGHERGAFTTALRRREGAFSRAGCGTLFLDEVAELTPPLQAKLLRVLERGTFLPVGAEQPSRTRARVVAATHRDLEAAVAEGAFREDLFHRLSVFSVKLPPLRERPEDLPRLIAHFVTEIEADLGRSVLVHPDAFARAATHAWPGNIRALRHALLRAAVLGAGEITAAGLVPDAAHRDAGRGGITIPRGDYASMKLALLRALVAEHGTIRKAAVAIGVPRSTLGAWLRTDGVDA